MSATIVKGMKKHGGSRHGKNGLDRRRKGGAGMMRQAWRGRLTQWQWRYED